jgi:hypothetical protein
MFGGLTARGRVLVVADAVGHGEIYVFDLDDGRLASHFEFSGKDGGYTDAGGVALGEDSSLWVPDTSGHVVRRLSLFGNMAGQVGLPPGAQPRDRRGLIVSPRAVAIDSVGQLWVACGDRPWAHGLQVFAATGDFVLSVPAFGGRGTPYGPALGLSIAEHRVWVADWGNDCIQCFREDGSFVGSFDLALGARPVAIATWPGGRAVLITKPRPAILVFDPDFRAGVPLALPAGDSLTGPCGLCITGDDLFVLDRDGARVFRCALDGSGGEVLFDLDEWK